LGLAALLAGSVEEFYNIAAGTGAWYAGFSLRWFSALTLFTILCVELFLVFFLVRWRTTCARHLITLRSKLGALRIVAAIILMGLPVLALQYTPWGVVIRGPYLRLLLWSACIGGMAWLLCASCLSVFTTRSLICALLLSGSALVIAVAFKYVTNYPFSLGWSEGNRLWDYSLVFGKGLYNLEPGTQPVAYLDIGRQIIGGLPFLLPKVSIAFVRSWLGVVGTVPYVLVGALAFFPRQQHGSKVWIAVSLFGLLFLNQGPIHAPLVICAILVLLARRLPVSWGAVLVLIAGYIAETSRFTWMFAPAMWSVMLEIGGGAPQVQIVPRRAWARPFLLGVAGLLGSAIALSGILRWTSSGVASSAVVSASQAMLWYRLLPNATYGDGILLGLVKAAGPLTALIALAWVNDASRSRLQAFVIGACLLAFLFVGMVVSTKIGGGGDLHNLDMFLVGLLLTAAVLWHAVGGSWLESGGAVSFWFRGFVVLCLVIPAFGPLMSLQPLSFASDADWISVLVGAERPRDLGSLPDHRTIEASLEQIRTAVAAAKGQVLFMDQRQLLTFGYLQGVELVPEYEKKRVMDEALSGNAAYFEPFYRDLADGRFGLVVSSPLRTPIKDNEYGFGEENNAWVEWVAKPVLCYYEELDTLNEVKVELLVPRAGKPSCESALPSEPP
jgi:hypothetical protein